MQLGAAAYVSGCKETLGSVSVEVLNLGQRCVRRFVQLGEESELGERRSDQHDAHA